MYDPAPKKRKITARRTKKGVLAKLKPWVLPATAGVTFYSAYVTRATDLFNQGLITKNDVFEAISYDVTHLDANAAMTRLSENAVNIATPLVGGFLVKETNIAGKHSGIIADVLYGLGIGMGGKALLDPPINKTGGGGIRSRPGNKIKVTQSTQTTQTEAAAVQGQGYNPYA